MKNWLKENWFKIVILFLLFIAVVIYGYHIWLIHHPYQTVREELDELFQKETDRRCRSGEISLIECAELQRSLK